MKSNIYNKKNSVLPWKATEILLLERVGTKAKTLEIKLAKIKGDVQEKFDFLERRVSEDIATHVRTVALQEGNRKTKESLEGKEQEALF